MNAKLLKSKIVAAGKTQEEVASIIGMSSNSLSRKINGKREFKLSEVINICNVLNITDPIKIFLSH